MKTNATTPIPQGYKSTPLGIIPQEWEVEPFHYLGQIYSGGTPDTEVEEYWNGDIAWCTPSDITKLTTKYIECTDVKITDKGLKESSATLLPPESIVVCTRATIGNAAICKINIATNQGFKNIIPNKETDTEWLYYMIVYSKPGLVRLGCGSTFLEVSKKDFSQFKIPVPPLAEQQKIAEVLGVWDKAIEKQSQLIEQLTLRKRGLMQQLLTAKRRLPGFSGRWEDIELGEVLTYEQPTPYIVRDTNYQNGYKTPVLTAGKTFILGYTNEDCGICNNIPVILFDDFTTDSRYIDFEFKVKSSATKLLRVKGNDNLYFIYCALRCLKYVVGGHERHWISKFQYLTISLPSIEEQTAIAEVLTAADREIELAQQKLELLRQQKRGLMQQLLTGKKRVKLYDHNN